MMLLCFIIIAVSVVGIGRNYMLREYAGSMAATADEVRRMVTASSGGKDDSDIGLKMFITAIGNSTGNLVMVTNEHGTIALCSDKLPNCSHIGCTLDDAYIRELDSSGCISGVDSLGSLFDAGRYVYAIRVEPVGASVSGRYVVVSKEVNSILNAWNRALSIVAVVAFAAFVIVMVFSFLYWKRMAKPLDEIAEVSRRFARGDFSVRVKQVSNPEDEMGALIESFNKMADSLENAEKRRAEFISNISHELRTPMTTIGGFADGILDGTIPDSDKDRYLAAISDETHRLARLVRNMLDVSRAKAEASDPSKRTVFDVSELLLQILLSFESRATAKNLDVDPQLPDNPIMVRADKDAITQVIYNLIDNAVKFARNGSCITLRLYKDEYKAYVAVKDEGETIPRDDLPFIFDRFHKSDRSRSIDKDGVGLGLYLVKSIINEHDEDIAVRSENGITEFVFTLSLA